MNTEYYELDRNTGPQSLLAFRRCARLIRGAWQKIRFIAEYTLRTLTFIVGRTAENDFFIILVSLRGSRRGQL
jgi:hypothetical protein